MPVMSEPWIDDVLRFWFDEIGKDRWFRKDKSLDAVIRARFAALHAQLSRDLAPAATATPDAALAAVIVFDQFSRNMFRGTPKAFASDALALRIAEDAISRGFDQQVAQSRRAFFYLPFEHSEDPAAQVKSVELYTKLGIAEYLPFAIGHKEIIDRFGRFPAP